MNRGCFANPWVAVAIAASWALLMMVPITASATDLNGLWNRVCIDRSCESIPEGFVRFDIGERSFLMPMRVNTARDGTQTTNFGTDRVYYEFSENKTPLRGIGLQQFNPVGCCNALMGDSGFGHVRVNAWLRNRWGPVAVYPYSEEGSSQAAQSRERTLSLLGLPADTTEIDLFEIDTRFSRIGKSFWVLRAEAKTDPSTVDLIRELHLFSREPLFYGQHVRGFCMNNSCTFVTTRLINPPHDRPVRLILDGYVHGSRYEPVECNSPEPWRECDKHPEDFDQTAKLIEQLEAVFVSMEVAKE